MVLVFNVLLGLLTLKSTGTLAKEGSNALTKVDLGMHCDKGHVAWSRILYYQLKWNNKGRSECVPIGGKNQQS